MFRLETTLRNRTQGVRAFNLFAQFASGPPQVRLGFAMENPESIALSFGPRM